MNPNKSPAEIVWNWRGRQDGGKSNSLANHHRIRGAVQSLIGAGIGVLLLFFVHNIIAYIAFAISGITLVVALLSPLGLFVLIQRFVGLIGQGIGSFLTWVLLAPFFYAVFAPFGLFFRRGANDRMNRGIDTGETSYWSQRDQEIRNLDSYKRLF